MVDMWTATPEAQEYPYTPTDGYRALLDRLRDLERQIGEARSALLTAAGISVDDAGMTIDSGLQVNGLLSILGPLSVVDGAIDPAAIAGMTVGAADSGGTGYRVLRVPN